MKPTHTQKPSVCCWRTHDIISMNLPIRGQYFIYFNKLLIKRLLAEQGQQILADAAHHALALLRDAVRQFPDMANFHHIYVIAYAYPFDNRQRDSASLNDGLLHSLDITWLHTTARAYFAELQTFALRHFYFKYSWKYESPWLSRLLLSISA